MTRHPDTPPPNLCTKTRLPGPSKQKPILDQLHTNKHLPRFCPCRTLLQALGGAGGGHAEIFIGPNMQRVPAGGGGGGGNGGDARGGGDAGAAGGPAAAANEGGGRGGGEGGMPDIGGGIAAMLGGAGGLGFLLRGFGMPGGLAGMGGMGMGPGGNVGDYAFGDLSQLIQHLMAADTNRVSGRNYTRGGDEILPVVCRRFSWAAGVCLLELWNVEVGTMRSFTCREKQAERVALVVFITEGCDSDVSTFLLLPRHLSLNPKSWLGWSQSKASPLCLMHRSHYPRW